MKDGSEYDLMTTSGENAGFDGQDGMGTITVVEMVSRKKSGESCDMALR
jgi:hypothetical protein